MRGSVKNATPGTGPCHQQIYCPQNKIFWRWKYFLAEVLIPIPFTGNWIVGVGIFWFYLWSPFVRVGWILRQTLWYYPYNLESSQMPLNWLCYYVECNWGCSNDFPYGTFASSAKAGGDTVLWLFWFTGEDWWQARVVKNLTAIPSNETVQESLRSVWFESHCWIKV